MDRIIRETIEVELHPNNMIREAGFYLSRSFQSVIYFVRFFSKHFSQDSLRVTFINPVRTGHTAFIKAATLYFPDTHQSWAFICFSGPDLFEAQPFYSSLVSYWFAVFVGVSQWEPRRVLASSLAFCITPCFPPTTCSPRCLLYVNILLLLGLLFDTEDGGDMFLRNMGSLSLNCKALYPRIWIQ
jgi:hypothetical protein